VQPAGNEFLSLWSFVAPHGALVTAGNFFCRGPDSKSRMPVIPECCREKTPHAGGRESTTLVLGNRCNSDCPAGTIEAFVSPTGLACREVCYVSSAVVF